MRPVPGGTSAAARIPPAEPEAARARRHRTGLATLQFHYAGGGPAFARLDRVAAAAVAIDERERKLVAEGRIAL